MLFYFFFNDTATTEIYTLSLHDALPISGSGRRRDSAPIGRRGSSCRSLRERRNCQCRRRLWATPDPSSPGFARALYLRSEEHTSELQSRQYLVCRLLLEKKKQTHLSKME